MVDANELRLSATEYTEAEYQLAKLVAKEVPVDQDARLLFFAEVDRCEERIRAVSNHERSLFSISDHSINGETAFF